jgi:exodeoxyribonuclease VII small subunit
LTEALDHYEKGVGLLKQCYTLLERAERRIELLSGVDAAGNPITEPFTDEEASLEEKSQNRARRRTKAPANANKGDKKRPGDPVQPPEELADSAQTRMDESGSLF